MLDTGFFYIFAIDRYLLHIEDEMAIKKSKGRLKLDYEKMERECILKFGVSSNVETLYRRMVSHKNGFSDLCKPEIALAFAIFVPRPYEIEFKLKSEFNREWVLPKELVDYLTTPESCIV
jgi:hypothetical protein